VSIRLQQALFAPLNKLKGFSFVDVETVEAAPAEDDDEIDAPASEEEDV